MKPLEIVRLYRSEDLAERPGEWRCGLARARDLMPDVPAAEAVDRLARLCAELDLPNPHAPLDLEGVTFAFRSAQDGQHFAGVLVRSPAGRGLRHSPLEEGSRGTEVVWFLPAPLEALIASEVRPEDRPRLEAAARPAPADTPPQESRPTRSSVRSVADLIARGEAATFSEYAAVRSGRDEFSSMSLTKLREALGEQAEEAEEAARALFPDLPDATLARVLRWVARGLPAAQAARITQVHDELAQAHRSPPS